MELKIQVDETKFKDVIEKELNAFSKEELHEIIRDCIIEGFKTDDVLKSFFTVERQASTWDTRKVTVAGELLQTAAKSLNLSSAFTEVQEMMLNEIKENHTELVEKVMLDLLIDGISNNYGFQSAMKETISRVLSVRNN